jgi:hypothetical protein
VLGPTWPHARKAREDHRLHLQRLQPELVAAGVENPHSVPPFTDAKKRRAGAASQRHRKTPQPLVGRWAGPVPGP